MYKQSTIDLILKQLPESRKIFKHEYRKALDNPYDSMLSIGRRFYDDDRVISKLQSSIDEKDLLNELNYHLNKTLTNLAGADYYYHYEKRWD